VIVPGTAPPTIAAVVIGAFWAIELHTIRPVRFTRKKNRKGNFRFEFIFI
jgi:hypothetical protein